MLELLGIPRMYRRRRTVHVQLADETAAAFHPDQFFAERPFLGALAESEETDEDVLCGVFV
jgi:hypothetical protein